MRMYDLKQIMKDAWRTYLYVAKKKGKTFGEVLKSTWRLAKLHAAIEIMNKEMDSKSQPLKPVSKPIYYDWGNLTASDIYPDNNRGYMGSKYCGD